MWAKLTTLRMQRSLARGDQMLGQVAVGVQDADGWDVAIRYRALPPGLTQKVFRLKD